jgi:hypothetical protein
MKKIISVMLMIAICASFSFADEGDEGRSLSRPEAQEAPIQTQIVREATLRTESQDFISGKVDTVIPADLLTRPKSKIIIVDESGKSEEFVLKALAVIYDSSGRFLTLNDIKLGEEVRINYITRADGTKEAISIKVLE